jgi:hypothetical protein
MKRTTHTVKVICRNYSYRDRSFTIVEGADGILRAIDHKYLDENGCINQELNGLQTYSDPSPKGNTLAALLVRINEQLDLLAYLDEHHIDKSDKVATIKAIIAFHEERGYFNEQC